MDYGSLGSDHVAEWQAGLQISWPIFTGGARSASIDRAEADLRAAQDELRLTQLQIDTEADAAEVALTESTARADALAAAVVQWEEVARIEALSVQEGAGIQSDLLRAEAGLFQARAGFARARHESTLATVRLARARGNLDMTWMATALEMAR
jgi:outer membrane protein